MAGVSEAGRAGVVRSGGTGNSLQEGVRGERPWAPLTPCCAVVFFTMVAGSNDFVH